MDEETKKEVIEKISAYLEARFNLFGFQQDYIRETAALIVGFILEKMEQ